MLGRASQKQVVNVAQRGGMCVVLVGRHAERLSFGDNKRGTFRRAQYYWAAWRKIEFSVMRYSLSNIHECS